MMPPQDWAIMPSPMHRNIVPGIHSARSGQRGEIRRSYTGAQSTTMGGSRPAGALMATGEPMAGVYTGWPGFSLSSPPAVTNAPIMCSTVMRA